MSDADSNVLITYKHISACPPRSIVLLAQLFSLMSVALVLSYVWIDLSVAHVEHEDYRDEHEEL